MSMQQAQQAHDRILRTWRYQDDRETNMVATLRGYLGEHDLAKCLAADIVKLIDEIETEGHLQKLRDIPADTTRHQADKGGPTDALGHNSSPGDGTRASSSGGINAVRMPITNTAAGH